ncbi:MAG: DUF4280 domain-containing protein [Deltaproteobacteria bacterium]|nr:MAG: DUF4280 domain-containing protein [Deltaproteobacteria bacterium]
MPMQVCAGAMLQCSFGVAPSSLVVTPENKVLTTTPAANIMDHKPIKNIISCGMCTTQSNPAVAAATSAATSAALGVYTPTPAPCVPATASPWAPGAPTVLIGNQPALNDTSTLTCTYGGVITIKSAGQTSVQIP